MARKNRKTSGELKMAIIEEHLIKKVSVADLCEKHKIKPSIYYNWQKQLFDRDDPADKVSPQKDSYELRLSREKISQLEAKLARKDEVVSELMEEHLKLKKSIPGGI